MDSTRFVETDLNSFYGEYLYDQIIPPDHFLRKLRALIDWSRFTRKLIKLYKGEGIVGRPPFDPALVLKVELLAQDGGWQGDRTNRILFWLQSPR